VTTSASVAYSSKAEDDRSIKDSQAHSLAITQLASARSRKEHKQSFRVSSVAGAQDLSVRTLTNKSANQAMRVDYFRMMRRWRVDLIRYGLRMTYDLVIPNPGQALAGRLIEVKALEASISSEFAFGVAMNDVTPTTWQNYAQQVGADIEAPPLPSVHLMQSAPLQKSIDQFMFGTVVFNLPDGYAATKGQFTAKVHVGDGDFNSGHRAQISLFGEKDMQAAVGSNEFPNKDGVYDVALTPGSIVARTGNVTLMYAYYNVESGGYVATLNAEPTQEARFCRSRAEDVA
jgi:hypothetical protein